MDDDAGWDLVAQRLRQEFLRRSLAPTSVATAIRMDSRTMTALLDGKGISRTHRLGDLANYLGWEGDAFDLIRRGEEPVPLQKSNEPDEFRFRSLERRVDRLEALIEDALQPPDPEGVE
jgi:hypothetical protein